MLTNRASQPTLLDHSLEPTCLCPSSSLEPTPSTELLEASSHSLGVDVEENKREHKRPWGESKVVGYIKKYLKREKIPDSSYPSDRVVPWTFVLGIKLLGAPLAPRARGLPQVTASPGQTK